MIAALGHLKLHNSIEMTPASGGRERPWTVRSIHPSMAESRKVTTFSSHSSGDTAKPSM